MPRKRAVARPMLEVYDRRDFSLSLGITLSLPNIFQPPTSTSTATSASATRTTSVVTTHSSTRSHKHSASTSSTSSASVTSETSSASISHSTSSSSTPPSITSSTQPSTASSTQPSTQPATEPSTSSPTPTRSAVPTPDALHASLTTRTETYTTVLGGHTTTITRTHATALATSAPASSAHRTLTIVLASVLPTLALLALLTFLFARYRRRIPETHRHSLPRRALLLADDELDPPQMRARTPLAVYSPASATFGFGPYIRPRESFSDSGCSSMGASTSSLALQTARA